MALNKGRRRMGPPASLPPAKREPLAERVDTKTGPQSKIKTLAPQKTSLPPKPVGVPDEARAKRGLSLPSMLRRQPRYILNSGEDCVVRQYKKGRTRGRMPAISGTARDMRTKPARPHKYQVIGLDADVKKLSTQKRIKVSCDCEFFTFYCEYALWTWGAANIRFSNGQPAHVRNPGNHPVICKHLAKVLMTIRQHND